MIIQIKIGQKILLAKERLDKFLLDTNIKEYDLISEIKGDFLKGSICMHPLKMMVIHLKCLY